MTSFLHCALYLAATGIGAFFLGRLLPKTWFRGDAFPYRCYPFEQKLFRVLHIKDWQSRVPDMSRILPGLMPDKKLTAETFSDLPRMIWQGIGGVLVTAVYILLGNLPFILIQRYNRPRLQRLLALQRRKQERKCQDAHTDTKLQYRRGA